MSQNFEANLRFLVLTPFLSNYLIVVQKRKYTDYVLIKIVLQLARVVDS